MRGAPCRSPLICTSSLLILATLVGCAAHNPHLAPVNSNSATTLPPDHIDLQPGWKLEVITPVLKSGGFQVHTKAVHSNSGTVALVAGQDFIGYESSYYVVRLSKAGQISVDFRSAQLHKDGKTARQARPLAPLFHVPPGTKCVRLMYLLRLSQADHDMAVVSGISVDDLETRTEAVRKDPADGCTAPNCYWIPAGIAVHRYFGKQKVG